MTKITIYGITYILILVLCANQCDRYKETEDCHRYIHFTNNSQNDVYYKFNFRDEIPSSNPVKAPEYYKISKNSNTKLSNSTGLMCFESRVENPPHLVYLYLFDPGVAENTPWETVREKKLYLKKYALTIDALNEMDWKITYSGD